MRGWSLMGESTVRDELHDYLLDSGWMVDL